MTKILIFVIFCQIQKKCAFLENHSRLIFWGPVWLAHWLPVRPVGSLAAYERWNGPINPRMDNNLRRSHQRRFQTVLRLLSDIFFFSTFFPLNLHRNPWPRERFFMELYYFNLQFRKINSAREREKVENER